MEIWIEEPIATPKERSCRRQNKVQPCLKTNKESIDVTNQRTTLPTSLSFMANMIAPACSAAFPTIGSKMTLIKAIGMFQETDAP